MAKCPPKCKRCTNPHDDEYNPISADGLCGQCACDIRNERRRNGVDPETGRPYKVTLFQEQLLARIEDPQTAKEVEGYINWLTGNYEMPVDDRVIVDVFPTEVRQGEPMNIVIYKPTGKVIRIENG